MATTAKQNTEKALALQSLKEWRIRPTETIYTIMRHVSASGMYRTIDVVIIRKTQPMIISYDVAMATGHRFDKKHHAIGMGGCGYDIGFEIVSSISHLLWPKGIIRSGEFVHSSSILQHRWI